MAWNTGEADNLDLATFSQELSLASVSNTNPLKRQDRDDLQAWPAQMVCHKIHIVSSHRPNVSYQSLNTPTNPCSELSPRRLRVGGL